MKNKLFVFALLGMFLAAGTSAYAEGKNFHGRNHHDKDKQCGAGKGDCGGQNQCPIIGKTLMKAHMMLKHKTDLSLTADQVKTIEDLKLQAEKNGVSQEAGMKLFMVELESKLHEEKIDVEGTNALIDKSFGEMAATTKSSVDTLAKLKSVLTPEQQAKAKELWQSMKEHREHDKKD